MVLAKCNSAVNSSLRKLVPHDHTSCQHMKRTATVSNNKQSLNCRPSRCYICEQVTRTTSSTRQVATTVAVACRHTATYSGSKNLAGLQNRQTKACRFQNRLPLWAGASRPVFKTASRTTRALRARYGRPPAGKIPAYAGNLRPWLRIVLSATRTHAYACVAALKHIGSGWGPPALVCLLCKLLWLSVLLCVTRMHMVLC